MKPIFSPNINKTGRLIRAGTALALFIGAWFAFQVSIWLGVLLVLAGGFTLFEAVRGWCVMRACGIKTKF